MRKWYSKKEFLACLVFGITFTLGASSWVGAAEKKPVKVGLLAPFSPPGDSAAGKRILWGAELAVKYVKDEMGGVLGGRPIELVIADDAGSPAEGIAGFRKLAQKDGVVAVVGQHHSSVCLAVTKISNDLGVPLFSTTAATPKITETQYPTVFSNAPLIPDTAKLYVDFMKRAGFKRVALLAEDTDFGTGFESWIKNYGADEGIEVKSIVFPQTMTDLTPALLETKAWRPNFIVNVGVGTSQYLMVKQAVDIGLFPQVPMLATDDGPVRVEFWNAVGEKGKYIMHLAFFKPGMTLPPQGEWFVSRYNNLYHEDITLKSLNVYSQILVIANALNKAQSDNPGDLMKALVNTTYQGWSGPVRYEEQPGMKWHHSRPPTLILQQTEPKQKIKDSKLVWPPEFGGDGKFLRP